MARRRVEHEPSIQESLERSSEVSKVIFNAPPAPLAYAYVILASAVFGLLISPTPSGVVEGLLVIGVPALLAGPLSAPLAQALGGTLYYKRAAFLAAVCVTLIGATLLFAIPVRFLWHVPVSYPLLFGYLGSASVRHAVLYATSDNRHLRTLPVSLLQSAIGIPFIAVLYQFGPDEILLTTLLPVVFLAPLLFGLHIFDAPLKRNFHVSASELFRYYLDHLTSGRLDGEAILNRFAEPIRAKFGVIGFRRQDGSLKAAIVVPALHPGPIGRLGGSDLPGKISEAVPQADLVMVPHGPATHDYNPVSTREVERLGRAVRDLLGTIEYREGGSVPATAGTDVRVTSQIFGDSALLAYTCWPQPIDDVDYGVGLAAELNAKLAGAREALFVDCHNSLLPGAGSVFLCTPRADAMLAASRDATEDAMTRRVDELQAGVAQDTETFGKAHGIGDQGVQALVVEAGGVKHAYVLWDGNNAVPEVTTRIGKELSGLVDSWTVMTTDNHSVNAVAGSYGPVGHLAKPQEVGEATRRVVERALENLEPVSSGFATGVLEDFRVYGNQKTVQLTSAMNVMTSILVELVLAVLIMQATGSALLILALRALGAP